MRWLHSFTRITDFSKLIGIHSFAAFLQLELFWVWVSCLSFPITVRCPILRYAFRGSGRHHYERH
ncbi:hypothetical protein BOM23_15375 [Erwinia sp. OLMDLW33]|nr:hypothetical protein BOM23_15375 [Erwinia sp. OLMDLW33]